MNYYFGYGILKDQTFINEILRYLPKGHGAILENFDLGYQGLDQIPHRPRNILKNIWGIGFKAYSVRSGKGIVAGIIWELTDQDVELLKKWEFIGIWREIIPVSVKLFNGNTLTAITTKASDRQNTEMFIDSLNYENNLNPQGKKQLYEDGGRLLEIQKIRKQIKEIEKNYSSVRFIH